MGKLSEIETSVFSLDIEDRNELLKWFAQAYYHNDELLEHGVYDEIYIRLSSKYKPLTEDAKVLELLKNIKQGKKEATVNNMSLIVLEQIMIGLKGELGLDVKNGIDKMLFDYHSRFNKEFINELYMEHLESNVGKKVVIVGRYEKQPMLETGMLEEVEPYRSVKVNGQDIKFIGFKHYIKSIRDEDNRVIFNNANNYDMRNLVEPEDINTEKVILFSKKVAQKARN